MNRNVGTFRLENLTCNVEEVEFAKEPFVVSYYSIEGIEFR